MRIENLRSSRNVFLKKPIDFFCSFLIIFFYTLKRLFRTDKYNFKDRYNIKKNKKVSFSPKREKHNLHKALTLGGFSRVEKKIIYVF